METPAQGARQLISALANGLLTTASARDGKSVEGSAACMISVHMGDHTHPGAEEGFYSILEQRLSRRIRPGDTLKSLGPNEHVIVFRPDCPPAAPHDFAERLLEFLSQPARVQGLDLFPRVNVGYAYSPVPTTCSVRRLARLARTALERATRNGTGVVALVNINDEAEVDISRPRCNNAFNEHRLRRALDTGAVVMHYQPYRCLETREIAGCEALMRIQTPEGELESPLNFIPHAENSGLIQELGRFALREASERAVTWRRRPFARRRGGFRIAVNVSAAQFSAGDVVSEVEAACLKSGCHPEWLTVEVTESMKAANIREVAEQVDALRRLGVVVALDDFGIEYSWLQTIQHLKADVLKIDRAFVQSAESCDRGSAILKSVISLAQDLDMRICAEGCLSEEQARSLHGMGVHYAQGRMFGGPMPDRAFERFASGSEPDEPANDNDEGSA